MTEVDTSDVIGWFNWWTFNLCLILLVVSLCLNKSIYFTRNLSHVFPAQYTTLHHTIYCRRTLLLTKKFLDL